MFLLLDDGFFQKKTPLSMFFIGRGTIIKAVIPLIIKNGQTIYGHAQLYKLDIELFVNENQCWILKSRTECFLLF